MFFCPLCLAHSLSLTARRHYDSRRNHQCEGGGDHQGGLGLPPLQEAAHQHARSGKRERRHQRTLLRRHAFPPVNTHNGDRCFVLSAHRQLAVKQKVSYYMNNNNNKKIEYRGKKFS